MEELLAQKTSAVKAARARQPFLARARCPPYKGASLGKILGNREKLAGSGIPHPDIFVDSFWGEPTAENLLSILRDFPPGTSKLVVHVETDERDESYPTGLDLG